MVISTERSGWTCAMCAPPRAGQARGCPRPVRIGSGLHRPGPELDAGEPEVHYQRSLALTRLGRRGEARAEQDTSARLRSEREHIQKLLTEMLVAPGDLEHQFDTARWLFEHGHPEEGLRGPRRSSAISRDTRRPTACSATITSRRGITDLPTSIGCRPGPSRETRPGRV